MKLLTLEEVRFATASGSLYPIDPVLLQNLIDESLAQIENIEQSVLGKPPSALKALIMPTTGYKYSSKVFGAGYSLLRNKVIDEVFILGSSIFHEIEKSAFADYRYWQTPLGKIEQTHRLSQIVSSDDLNLRDLLQISNSAHDGESAIEIQLPYLQTIVNTGNFKIIPFLLGKKLSPRLLIQAIHKFIDHDDLMIVGAELSQGYPSDYAIDIDEKTISRILKLDTSYISEIAHEVQNANGIMTVMEMAKLRGWKAYKIAYENILLENQPNLSKGLVAIGFYSS